MKFLNLNSLLYLQMRNTLFKQFRQTFLHSTLFPIKFRALHRHAEIVSRQLLFLIDMSNSTKSLYRDIGFPIVIQHIAVSFRIVFFSSRWLPIIMFS